MLLSPCRLAVIPMKMWQFSQWTLSDNCPWNFWRRGSLPTSDSRKTFWGLSSTSWKRTGKETSSAFIFEWVLMFLLLCRSAGWCKHKASTVALSSYYFCAVSHMAADSRSPPPLNLCSSSLPHLLFILFHSVFFFPSPSFLHRWVSILFGRSLREKRQANVSTDPFQSVCISQRIHVKTSYSSLSPNQSWMDFKQLSVINEFDFAVVTVCVQRVKRQAVLMHHPFHSCERGVAV